jgi:predicted RNase H-like nuclease (RuvC/YqgF family)
MWWLVLIVFGLMIPEILSTVLESRLGRAVAAHIENRGKAAEPGALAERIRSLEGEVDRLSGEVQRLTDEAEFFPR